MSKNNSWFMRGLGRRKPHIMRSDVHDRWVVHHYNMLKAWGPTVTEAFNEWWRRNSP